MSVDRCQERTYPVEVRSLTDRLDLSTDLTKPPRSSIGRLQVPKHGPERLYISLLAWTPSIDGLSARGFPLIDPPLERCALWGERSHSAKL